MAQIIPFPKPAPTHDDEAVMKIVELLTSEPEPWPKIVAERFARDVVRRIDGAPIRIG